MEHKSILKEKLELKSISEVDSDAFQRVCCPSCDAPVPADQININDRIAKCHECHVVFPFYLKSSSQQLVKSVEKVEIKRPEGVDFFPFSDSLHL